MAPQDKLRKDERYILLVHVRILMCFAMPRWDTVVFGMDPPTLLFQRQLQVAIGLFAHHCGACPDTKVGVLAIMYLGTLGRVGW